MKLFLKRHTQLYDIYANRMSAKTIHNLLRNDLGFKNSAIKAQNKGTTIPKKGKAAIIASIFVNKLLKKRVNALYFR